MKLATILKNKLRCQKGQGAVEYAMATIGVVIVIAAVLFVTGATNPLQTAITDTFEAVSAQVTASLP